MNRKGQALIEFVLILPVFLLIIFTIVDFGNIFYSKYELQSESADIVRMVKKSTDYADIFSTYSKLDIEIVPYKDDYLKINVSKEVKLITPFLDRIFGNHYLIEVERIVPDDEA